jgi:hypothetical protein
MPHHWWLVDPDNPGPDERAKAIRKGARAAGGKVRFVGRTRKNTWFVLVDVDKEAEDAVYKAVGGRGKLFELEGLGRKDDKDDDEDDYERETK